MITEQPVSAPEPAIYTGSPERLQARRSRRRRHSWL